jgi:hypothetical protein
VKESASPTSFCFLSFPLYEDRTLVEIVVVVMIVCVVDTTCFVEDFQIRGMCVNGLRGSTVLELLLPG